MIILRDDNFDIPLALQHLKLEGLGVTLQGQIYEGLSKAEATQLGRIRELYFRPYRCHADCRT
jgi:hypothetical protein